MLYFKRTQALALVDPWVDLLTVSEHRKPEGVSHPYHLGVFRDQISCWCRMQSKIALGMSR